MREELGTQRYKFTIRPKQGFQWWWPQTPNQRALSGLPHSDIKDCRDQSDLGPSIHKSSKLWSLFLLIEFKLWHRPLIILGTENLGLTFSLTFESWGVQVNVYFWGSLIHLQTCWDMFHQEEKKSTVSVTGTIIFQNLTRPPVRHLYGWLPGHKFFGGEPISLLLWDLIIL